MKTKLAVIFLSLSISFRRKCLLVALVFPFLMHVSCSKDDTFETTGISTIDNASTLGTATGTTYYVSPTGNDDTSGDIAHPWLTWQKAFTTAVAGDIVYFRGGVWYYSTAGSGGIGVTHSGSAGNYISFFNYPGETPILDLSTLVTTDADYQRAISVFSKSYIHFKGLTVRNVNQLYYPGSSYGNNYTYSSCIDNYSCNHLIYENMTIYNIEGVGLGVYGCDEVLIKNCDVHHLCDNHASNAGQNGTGIAINVMADNYGASMYNVHIYVEGCRVWNASDNGFAGTGHGYVEFKNCWMFNCGQLKGEGCWKTGSGYGNNATNPLCRLIVNCISADNGNYGFGENNDNGSVMNGHFYNNFAYHNGYKHSLQWWNSTFGVGFCIFDYTGSTPAPNEMFSNNIAYANEYANVWEQNPYNHNHNSWDQSVTVTAADFQSLDTAQLRWARQSDGSLPEITFGKLASTSDLIDKGVNVGLPYIGSAPDIGWFESSSGSGTAPVYASSSIANVTPSILEMTYNSTLANIVPAASAFSVMVNLVARTVSSVSISGTKVLLTLASPVAYGNTVTVAYTKPATNPLQTTSGGQAASITAQTVTNNLAAAVVIPVYISSSVANATPSILEMTYNSTLANIVPVISAFSVMVNSVARTVSSISISGTKVLLTLASPVVYGNTVTVLYTKPATNPLQTTSGGQATSITAQSVTNNVAAAVVIPVYTSSSIANATPSVLEMTYNSTLANIVPATSAFTVMVNSATRTISSISISGTMVSLTLASPVVYGNAVTVAYTKPATNPIQTSSGGQAASITTQSVVNNCIPSTNQPPVVSISSPVNGSSFRSPATITITANASDINGTISKVEFFNGTIKLGERTTTPYSFVWKNVPRGTYSITAIATDNLNSKTVSIPVSVSVRRRTY
jgi:uncharacterized repeat protein (TIGR02059 family)